MTETDVSIPTNKPPVNLSSRDGNVFILISACVAAAERAGWSEDEVNAFAKEVRSTPSYDDALQCMMKYFNVS